MKIDLTSYCFADAESRQNAELALDPPRPSLFIIVGPRMSGKTRLARALSASLEARPGMLSGRCRAREWSSRLAFAVHRGAVCFDDVGPRFAHHCWELEAFVTLPFYSYRKPWTTEMVEVENKTVVFVTGEHISETEDLQRRAKFIRMEIRKRRLLAA